MAQLAELTLSPLWPFCPGIPEGPYEVNTPIKFTEWMSEWVN